MMSVGAPGTTARIARPWTAVGVANDANRLCGSSRSFASLRMTGRCHPEERQRLPLRSASDEGTKDLLCPSASRRFSPFAYKEPWAPHAREAPPTRLQSTRPSDPGRSTALSKPPGPAYPQDRLRRQSGRMDSEFPWQRQLHGTRELSSKVKCMIGNLLRGVSGCASMASAVLE